MIKTFNGITPLQKTGHIDSGCQINGNISTNDNKIIGHASFGDKITCDNIIINNNTIIPIPIADIEKYWYDKEVLSNAEIS